MTVNEVLWKKHCIKSLSIICLGYLLESHQRGNSNKYPKHMFYEEIKIKQGFSYISFCPLRILYNSKFIIMATFLGTNAVVVLMVYRISNQGHIVCDFPFAFLHTNTILKRSLLQKEKKFSPGSYFKRKEFTYQVSKLFFLKVDPSVLPVLPRLNAYQLFLRTNWL